MREPQTWLDFLTVARPRLDRLAIGAVLCLDPGETTGWTVFDHGDLLWVGQEPTGQEPALMSEFIQTTARDLRSRIRGGPLEHIVFEEYRIRGNKAKEHVGSEVVTIQHIGAIKVAAGVLGVRLHKQSAGMAKGFTSDQKLRNWGLYQTGNRHANDAIRHAVYWHLFNAGR